MKIDIKEQQRAQTQQQMLAQGCYTWGQVEALIECTSRTEAQLQEVRRLQTQLLDLWLQKENTIKPSPRITYSAPIRFFSE